MSYDAPPLQTDLSPEQAEVARATKLELPADLRRKLNAYLPDGYGCAVLYPPGLPPQVVGVKLPRSSSGYPPRRPVQIPLDSFKAVQLQQPRRVTKRQLAKQKAAKSAAEALKNAAQSFIDPIKAHVAKTCSRFTESIKAKLLVLATLFGRLGAVGTVEATA